MTSDDLLKLAGLRPEMREAAREAARREGISVSEWLESLVSQAAAKPAEKSEPARRSRRLRNEPRTTQAQKDMQAISARLEKLTEQISDLSGSTAPSPADKSDDDGDLSQTLRAIEERIASMGPNSPPLSPAYDPPTAPAPRASERAAPETQRGFEVDHRSAYAASSVPDPRRSFEFDESDLDRAMAEIAQRQQALDDPTDALQTQFAALSQRLDHAPRAEAGGLHDQMAELTHELQSIRATGGFESAVNALRRELADINHKLTDAAPRQAVQALEAEVRALADRIDEGRLAGGNSEALAGIEAGLADVYQSLRQLAPAESLAAFREEVNRLDQKIETMTARWAETAPNGAWLRQLERAVGELHMIAQRAASGDALVALAEEVQQISTRTDRILASVDARENSVTTMIEERFQELARHLDGRQQSSIATAQNQINSVVNALAEKLERVEVGAADSSKLNAIAGQLNQITQRLETSDSRIDQFGHVERSFGELVSRMDSLHASAMSAAAAAPAAPGELSALRHDLNNLQHSQQQSDRRTQHTLESVHDTLAKLVDRLALAETRPAERPVAERRASDYPAPPRASAHEAIPTPQAETQPRLPPALPLKTERAPIDPTLPADFPLEPGAAGSRPPSSDAALNEAPTPLTEDSKANFIAAARRAAQAASKTSNAEQSAADDKPAGSGLGALARRLAGKRALMLCAILLAGIGIMHLTLNQPETRPLSDVKRVTTASIKPDAPAPRAADTRQSAATPAPAATTPLANSYVLPAAATTATVSPPAISPPVAASASASGERQVSAVSPLTIASIQLPAANDLTATVSRSTGLTSGSGDASRTVPAAGELPDAFSRGLRTAALSGNGAAEYEIGVRFAEGRDVGLNHQEAARWLERAASRGLAPAQYRLGSLYEKGNGVRKDLDQARRLYRAAADVGNGKAMHNLAVLYAEGLDGKPDFRNALEWFRKASNHGIPDSQYNVAILYARGLGSDQNLAESYKWFALAAQSGDADAGKKRDDVAARLDPAQLQAAQQAVQAFRALPQPDEAVMVNPPAGGWDSASPAGGAKPKSALPRRRTQT